MGINVILEYGGNMIRISWESYVNIVEMPQEYHGNTLCVYIYIYIYSLHTTSSTYSLYTLYIYIYTYYDWNMISYNWDSIGIYIYFYIYIYIYVFSMEISQFTRIPPGNRTSAPRAHLECPVRHVARFDSRREAFDTSNLQRYRSFSRQKNWKNLDFLAHQNEFLHRKEVSGSPNENTWALGT